MCIRDRCARERERERERELYNVATIDKELTPVYCGQINARIKAPLKAAVRQMVSRVMRGGESTPANWLAISIHVQQQYVL